MVKSEQTQPSMMRLSLSSVVLAVAVASAVTLALLNQPKVIVLGLSLISAIALIDVAGTVSARRDSRANHVDRR